MGYLVMRKTKQFSIVKWMGMGHAAKDDSSFQKPHTSKTKEVGLGLGLQSWK